MDEESPKEGTVPASPGFWLHSLTDAGRWYRSPIVAWHVVDSTCLPTYAGEWRPLPDGRTFIEAPDGTCVSDFDPEGFRQWSTVQAARDEIEGLN